MHSDSMRAYRHTHTHTQIDKTHNTHAHTLGGVFGREGIEPTVVNPLWI